MLRLDVLPPEKLTQVPYPFMAVRSPTSNSNATISPTSATLRKAAGEFEGILLESLWKSMKETFSNQDDENLDPTSQSYDEWGIQGMASAVGKAGGLGIKNMIIKDLEPMTSGGQGGNFPGAVR